MLCCAGTYRGAFGHVCSRSVVSSVLLRQALNLMLMPRPDERVSAESIVRELYPHYFVAVQPHMLSPPDKKMRMSDSRSGALS